MSESIKSTSNNIRVFPTTLREGVDPAAKFTTEYNLTSLINKLLDRKAFVITDTLSISDEYVISQLDFNIMGYFFSVKNLDISSLIPNDLEEDVLRYINATIQVVYQPCTQTSEDTRDEDIFYNWSQLKSSNTEKPEKTSIYTGVTFNFSDISTLLDSTLSDPDKENLGIDKNSISNRSEGIIESTETSATKSGSNLKTRSYIFTILKIMKDDTGKISIWIPDESKIRFQTDQKNHHSVIIDDGDLDDPVQI